MSQQANAYGEPNAVLGREGTESGAKAEDTARLLVLFHERLRFETLLSRLSASFINLPAEAFDGHVERALQQIVEFLGVERSSLAQFSEDGRELRVTHSYSIPGFPPSARMNLAAVWPWYTEQLRQGKLLRFSRLPDDAPPEAVHEREHVIRAGGPRSHLAIPFQVGDAVLGAIGFGSFRRECPWSDDLVQGLRLVGEVFANALARKRADAALRESEGRFRRMADAAPVMVWMSGPDKRCTYFNRHWLEFTGRPLQREVGDGWSEGVHADDLPRCLGEYGRAFDARQAFRMEYRLRRSDGEYRWVLDTGVPRFESDGAFEGYIGSCIDITDQKRVEGALRESEARLRFLLESTRAVPWVADAVTWQFTYVGPQASELLGYPQEAWYAKDFWADHVHPDDREATLAFCREHSQGHTDYQFDYRMVSAAGRAVWIHDVVNVVAEDGAPRLLRGFMIDVTDRRRAEEELRGLREQFARVGRATTMGELAASIAHEVNQPLCAIVTNAQAVRHMLDGGGDLTEVREAVQDIARDGQRASAVIARIRGLLRKAPPRRAAVGVNDLIREVCALTRGEMARRGVAVKLELAEGLPAVSADRVQLQQVILNLMANGADAMDGVAREARELVVRSDADGAGAVAVAVQDAGAGIPPGDVERVFDPFFTTKAGSIGMGLAICKSIVQAHGGRIGAGPNAGRGATVRFTLPGVREGDP
jgi:PAS domain S-box-containing protein